MRTYLAFPVAQRRRRGPRNVTCELPFPSRSESIAQISVALPFQLCLDIQPSGGDGNTANRRFQLRIQSLSDYSMLFRPPAISHLSQPPPGGQVCHDPHKMGQPFQGLAAAVWKVAQHLAIKDAWSPLRMCLPPLGPFLSCVTLLLPLRLISIA